MPGTDYKKYGRIRSRIERLEKRPSTSRRDIRIAKQKGKLDATDTGQMINDIMPAGGKPPSMRLKPMFNKSKYKSYIKENFKNK
jgi:hypothetical protein